MKRLSCFAFVAVVVALLISVALNVVLFNRARQYYLDLNAVRLNPLNLSSYPDAAPAPAVRPRLVFFGDSRAARWPVTADDNQFEVINRGVEAETSAQATLRFAAHITALQPAIVVVQVGVNDLKTIPLFPEHKAAIIAATKENVRYIVEQTAALGAQVILTTIFPVRDFPLERRLFWSPEIEAAVEEVNTDLRSLAADNVIILDATAILADNGRAKPEYYLDELHLNDAGYTVLNQELAHLLSGIE